MEYIISLSTQTRGFLISIGFGALVGAWYDLIRIIRLTFTKSGRAALMVSDIFFVLSAALMTFLFLLTVTDGEIRLYILFGELIGFVIYYFSFGVIAVRFTQKTVNKIKKAVKRIFGFVFAPFIKIFRFFGRKTDKLFKIFQKMSKKFDKNAKILLQKDKALLYNLTDKMRKSRKKLSDSESDGNYGDKDKKKIG